MPSCLPAPRAGALCARRGGAGGRTRAGARGAAGRGRGGGGRGCGARRPPALRPAHHRPADIHCHPPAKTCRRRRRRSRLGNAGLQRLPRSSPRPRAPAASGVRGAEDLERCASRCTRGSQRAQLAAAQRCSPGAVLDRKRRRRRRESPAYPSQLSAGGALGGCEERNAPHKCRRCRG